MARFEHIWERRWPDGPGTPAHQKPIVDQAEARTKEKIPTIQERAFRHFGGAPFMVDWCPWAKNLIGRLTCITDGRRSAGWLTVFLGKQGYPQLVVCPLPLSPPPPPPPPEIDDYTWLT